jgi:hypothetical protein
MKRTLAISLSSLLLVVNFFGLVAPGGAYAQSLIELRGTVIDETNAYIAAAPLVLDDGQGKKYTAVADDHGRYRFTVKPGTYTLSVEVEGFGKFSERLDLTTKPTGTYDVKLKVGLAEQVEVKDNSTSISTDPDRNLSAITLTEKDLEALPDDPDELLQTLKQIAPRVARVGAIRDLASPSEMGMLGAIQAIMPAFAMPLVGVGGRDAVEFERAIEAFAREPNGGLIILPSPVSLVHRQMIMSMAARHRVPAIYPYAFFAREGGLISYGIVASDNFRRAAGYVDRILKGAKPAELPVQVPTKFELVINLKTAKALGLEIPPTLLAIADEVIDE